MKLKIIYRSSVVWSIVLFNVFTLLFAFVCESIFLQQSALSLDRFREFLTTNLFVGALFLLATVTSFKLKKSSLYFESFYALAVSGVVLLQLFSSFDKFIILMLFVFILIAYYFCISLKVELDKAFLNPRFSQNELFEPMLYKMKALINEDENGGIRGHLTNWDEQSCFIYLDAKEMDKVKINKSVDLKISYNEHNFTQSAKVISISYNNGVGLKFEHNKEDSLFNWKEFYQIVEDLGFTVEYMK